MPPPLDPTVTESPSTSWEVGDEPGFERLVERYAPLVHARCARALPGSDAQDATQAVFSVLARRAEHVRPHPELVAWLMRVTENVVRNALRDRHRRSRAEREAGALPRSTPAVGRDLDLEELGHHLDEAMAELPAAEREALTLHYLAGHSVADTAVMTSAGLSTIKDRLQRGVERLRAQLRRKGYQASDVALLGLLPRLTGPLPSTLLAQLRRLRTTPPSSIPSHIRRWARQGPAMTTLIATLVTTAIATSLLGASGTLETLPGADTPTAMPTHQSAGPVSAQVCTTLDDLDAAIRPELARSYAVLRWPDGARTAARLVTLPELRLLADHGQALIQQLQSVRQGTLLVVADSMEPRAKIVSRYQVQHDLAHLAPGERFQRQLRMEQTEIESSLQQAKNHQPPQVSIPALTGTIQLSAPDAPIMAWLRQVLAQPRLLGCTVAAHDPTWVLGNGSSSLTLALQGPSLSCSSISSFCPAPIFPPLTSFPASVPAADIEIMQSMDPGTGAFTQLWDASLAITPEGLHLAIAVLPQDAPGTGTSAQPKVDRTAFDRLPSDTLLAGAYALTPATSELSQLVHGVLSNLKIYLKALTAAPADLSPRMQVVDRFQEAMLQIDGQVLCYVEPGPLIPVVTLTADLPQAPSQALIRALAQMTAHSVNAAGAVVIPSGMLSLTIGWSHGQLIFTSSPDGVAVAAGKHGFTQQPEIRRALAALPSGDTQALVLLRPQALVQALSAIAPMISPQLSAQLPGYQQSLTEHSAYGYFTMVNGGAGTRIEASGLLAIIAAACLAMQVQIPHAAN